MGGVIAIYSVPLAAVMMSSEIALYPYYSRYYFEKGRYCISAEFKKSYKTKYEKLMPSWYWKEGKCS